MKKTVLSVLSVLLLLCTLLSSCTGANTPDTGTTEKTEAPTQAPTPPVSNEPAKLQINGVDISQYTIIYAESEFVDVMAFIGSQFDYGKVTATRLSDLIFERFGVRLETKCDANTAVSQYEILVGKTNREESKIPQINRLAIDNYLVKLNGDKLLICGGAHGTTYHAVDSLESWFLTTVENNLYNVTPITRLSGSYHLKRIACIGDSITAGATATDRNLYSYPAYLGRMYWQEGVVYQYGISSKTMRDDLADSYMKTSEWTSCLANTEKYDAVLIMLGTNDSNRDQQWTTADDDAFKSSCRTLCSKLKQHSPNAELVIMNCPVSYRTTNFGSLQVRNLQAIMVNALKQDGYKIHLYDMYNYSRVEMGQAMFPDDLHPTNRGYAKMAYAIHTMLGHLFAGETSQYLLN